MYTAMFTHVANRLDYPMWFSFMDTFCHRDVSFLQILPDISASFPVSPRYIRMSGTVQSSQFLFNRMLDCPDYAIEVKNHKIFLHADGTSHITCSFAQRGTSVVYAFTDQLLISASEGTRTDKTHDCDASSEENIAKRGNQQEETGALSFVVEYETQCGTASCLLGYHPQAYQEILNSLPLLETPMSIELTGLFTMQLDVNKKITNWVTEVNGMTCIQKVLC